MSNMYNFAVVAIGSRDDVARFQESARGNDQAFALSSFAPSPSNLEDWQLPTWREKTWGCDEVSPSEVFGPADLRNDGTMLQWDLVTYRGVPWPVVEAASRLHPELDLVAAAVEPDSELAEARRYRNGAIVQTYEMPEEQLTEALSGDDSESRYVEDGMIDELVKEVTSGLNEQTCSSLPGSSL